MSDQGTTVNRTREEILPDGRSSSHWTLESPDGIRVELLGLGARLQELWTADRDGRLANVALGARSWEDRLAEGAYFGATVGRYGNRIAGGELLLDGVVHGLRTQAPGHTLHGGPDGFATRVWEGTAVSEGDASGVMFRLTSPDGDQGFPGTLHVTVTYLLDTAGALTIRHTAVGDALTVVNPTNHTYFNLAGEGSGGILDHLLTVDADHYLPVDAGLIPLGPPEPVTGTPFDLTQPTRLAGRMGLDHPQLRLAGGGFDHNWVLNGTVDDGPVRAAVLEHPASGRRIECLTTEPGLQVYTGNLLDGSLTGGSGVAYGRHAGIALETQHFPDSPHQPSYPSTVLRPGERFTSTTIYRCDAR